MKYLERNNGFSVVEIMVSVSIVIVGILGSLSLAFRNIQAQGFNEKNLIASQLAQEGVELARNIRDEVWASGGGGGSFIDGDKIFTVYYDQDRIRVKEVSGLSSDDAKLFLDNNSYYIHSNSSSLVFSGFRRVVQVSAYQPNVSRRLVSTVSWNDRGQDYSYVIETELYEWKQ